MFFSSYFSQTIRLVRLEPLDPGEGLISLKLSINLFIYESGPNDEKIEGVLFMQIQILNLLALVRMVRIVRMVYSKVSGRLQSINRKDKSKFKELRQKY
jgi:hypothetical protein